MITAEKKKELIGNYLNAGRQWRASGEPLHVQGHDFPAPEVPRAFPYGIYDIGRNAGFVNVGTDHDTGAFAVASIRGWWRAEGRRLYPDAEKILITFSAGVAELHPEESGEDAIRRADQAMYLAKRAGKNRVLAA